MGIWMSAELTLGRKVGVGCAHAIFNPRTPFLKVSAITEYDGLVLAPRPQASGGRI